MFQKDAQAIRVLAGANVFFKDVGAIMEIVTRDEQKAAFVAAYETELRKVLDALGWDDVPIHKRVYSKGFIFAIPTEYDYSYAGCKILGITLDMVTAVFDGLELPDFNEEVSYLEYVLSRERYITVRNIYKEARERSLNVFIDEGTISIGSGKGAFIAKLDEIGFGDVPWDKIYEVPSVMVTGTNGKTTTVRLTSFINKHAGKVVGYCSTDWVMVDGQIVSEGDLSGPRGNQTVLTDPRVEVAVLEVARGGLIKRGIVTSSVNGAAVMNVGADHLGVNGIDTVEDLAEAKFLVHDGVKPGGHSIINLDDQLTHQFMLKIDNLKAYVSQKLPEAEILSYLKDGDYAAYVDNGAFYVHRDGQKHFIANINDVDLTYKGLAKHNIENVLVAICLSLELGRTYQEIHDGLVAFVNDENNQGRFNFFEINKSRFIVDYGHNHAAVATIFKFARQIAGPETKLTALLGFSGDRKFMIKDIAKSVIEHKIDNIIIKQFHNYARGAERGELAEMLRKSLIKNGFDENNIIATVDTEIEAAEIALSKSNEDQIFIMLCQEDIPGVIAKLKSVNVAS